MISVGNGDPMWRFMPAVLLAFVATAGRAADDKGPTPDGKSLDA